MHQKKSFIVTASWIKPLLISILETSDGLEYSFFIAASIGSITDLEGVCCVLNLFLDYIGGFLYCQIAQDITVFELQ